MKIRCGTYDGVPVVITCWHDVQHFFVDALVNLMQKLHVPTRVWEPIQLWQWYSCNRYDGIEPARGPIFRAGK